MHLLAKTLLFFLFSHHLLSTPPPFLAEEWTFTDFTEKKDITTFIHSQFLSPPTMNIEYFTGEVQVGAVQVYPGDESSWLYTTYETGSHQRLFYQFMSADGAKISVDRIEDQSKPIILWMQGGPGCSDWFGANTEFGPYRLHENVIDGKESIYMKENINSWAKYAYLLFVDNPFGDGLSPVIGNSTGQVPMVGSAQVSAAVMQKFLEKFLEIYPLFLQHPFYIFGESFGGHYVPALSSRLVKYKSNAGAQLKGIGFGDGWTSPLDQAGCYGPYLYSAGIASTKRKEIYKLLSGTIQEAIMVDDYPTATSLFFNYDGGMGPNSKIRVTQTNLLNYRQYFQDYPSSDALAKWIGYENVRQAFNLPKNITDPFVDCNNNLYMNFNYDTPVDYSGNVSYLLKNGYKVMLYEGQVDPDVSQNGVMYYLRTLQWPQFKYWQKTAKKIWYNPQSPYENWGWYKVYGKFSYVLVNNAGHLVPHDQGAPSQETVFRFINDLW